MVLSSSEFRLFCSGTVNSTIYEFLRKVFKLFLNLIFDPVLYLFEIVTAIHMKTLRSSGIECQWDEVTYELPSINHILDAEKMIHCMKESCTIQHFPKKLTWVCSSWGKFFKNLENLFRIDVFLSIYSGHGCSVAAKRRVKEASDQYLRMENNNLDKEKIHFPTRKLWSQSESDENKYKKSLSYILDKITYTVPNSNRSPLLFRLINVIFWNKIE